MIRARKSLEGGLKRCLCEFHSPYEGFCLFHITSNPGGDFNMTAKGKKSGGVI